MSTVVRPTTSHDSSESPSRGPSTRHVASRRVTSRRVASRRVVSLAPASERRGGWRRFTAFAPSGCVANRARARNRDRGTRFVDRAVHARLIRTMDRFARGRVHGRGGAVARVRGGRVLGVGRGRVRRRFRGGAAVARRSDRASAAAESASTASTAEATRAREALTTYYRALCAIESRIPISPCEGHAEVEFAWFEAGRGPRASPAAVSARDVRTKSAPCCIITRRCGRESGRGSLVPGVRMGSSARARRFRRRRGRLGCWEI